MNIGKNVCENMGNRISPHIYLSPSKNHSEHTKDHMCESQNKNKDMQLMQCFNR